MKTIKFLLATTCLCASFILSSCYKQNDALKENLSTNSDSFSQNTSDNFNIQDNEKDFEKIHSELFSFLVSKSSLNLHFLFADKNNYPNSSYKLGFEEISVEEFDNNIAYFESIDARLKNIVPEYLSLKNQKTYKLISRFINNSLQAKGLALFYEPLAIDTGIQASLPTLFYEYSFDNILDIHNYLDQLSLIDEYFEEILNFEKQKKLAGTFMSNTDCDLVIQSLDRFILSPNENFLKESFINKLNNLNFLNEEQKQTYINKHNIILEEDFYFAYANLKSGLEELKKPISYFDTMPNKAETFDIKQSPSYHFQKDKKELLQQQFNDYLIKTKTYTSYANIEELEKEIRKNLDTDLKIISTLFTENTNLAKKEFSFENNDPKAILEFFNSNIKDNFPTIDNLSYELIPITEFYNTNLPVAFFKKAKLDDKNSNKIYINQNKLDESSLYTSLAHEGIPGHLYQWTYFINKNPNYIDTILANKAYLEGFALYAEALSFHLDPELSSKEALFYEKNLTSTFALYALLDIEINYYKKDKNFVANYLKTSYNILDKDISNNIYTLILSNPFTYLTYYTGYMEISDLKQDAKKMWGNSYSELAFNTFILDASPLAFSDIKDLLNNK